MYPRWDIPTKRSTDEKVLIMGILNVTPDSFSDGGRFFDANAALEQAGKMADQGADIIDVGGESTRPFSDPVTAREEIDRVIPVIKVLAPDLDVPVSIDTYKPEVAEKGMEAGAVIVNDVFGLRSEGMARVIADHGAGCVIMHMKGRPKNMQKSPRYGNVVAEIKDFLGEKTEEALEAGVKRSKIAVDPGLGFGKTVGNNYEIMRRLEEFNSLEAPVLVGPSRKSFIGAVTGEDIADRRVPGSLAAVTACILNGARIVRAHDVAQTKQAVDVARAIMEME